MSQYLCVYLRMGDNFAPIGTYSRSHMMYQAFSHYPYEHIRAVKPTDLTKIMSHLREMGEDYNKALKKTLDSIDMIINAANTPLEEKLDVIDNYQDYAEEIKQKIEEVQDAIGIVSTYEDIIDAYHYSDLEQKMDNDYFHYLYAGIEAYGAMENVEGE